MMDTNLQVAPLKCDLTYTSSLTLSLSFIKIFPVYGNIRDQITNWFNLEQIMMMTNDSKVLLKKYHIMFYFNLNSEAEVSKAQNA